MLSISWQLRSPRARSRHHPKFQPPPPIPARTSGRRGTLAKSISKPIGTIIRRSSTADEKASSDVSTQLSLPAARSTRRSERKRASIRCPLAFQPGSRVSRARPAHGPGLNHTCGARCRPKCSGRWCALGTAPLRLRQRPQRRTTCVRAAGASAQSSFSGVD